jgi:hypothetical protein
MKAQIMTRVVAAAGAFVALSGVLGAGHKWR